MRDEEHSKKIRFCLTCKLACLYSRFYSQLLAASNCSSLANTPRSCVTRPDISKDRPCTSAPVLPSPLSPHICSCLNASLLQSRSFLKAISNPTCAQKDIAAHEEKADVLATPRISSQHCISRQLLTTPRNFARPSNSSHLIAIPHISFQTRIS